MNHGAGPEITLKKPYSFNKTNKQQQQQQGKKSFYPTAILFAGVNHSEGQCGNA